MKKQYVNLSRNVLAGLLPGLLLIGMAQSCSHRAAIDTFEIDAKVVAAQATLDSLNVLSQDAQQKAAVFKNKCDSLCPVVGVHETPAERARKDAQWRQYRDSLSKYYERVIDLEVEKVWAELNVDTLKCNQKIIKQNVR